MNPNDKEKLSELHKLLDEILENAKEEDECTDVENDMLANMQNLKESICYYYETIKS
jgi:hypothetical protein